MNDDLFVWGVNAPQRAKTYAQQQRDMLVSLKTQLLKYTEYQSVVALVEESDVVDLAVPRSNEYKTTSEMVYSWEQETAAKILTIMRLNIDFEYYIKVSGTCGQGRRGGWLHEKAKARKSVGFDKRILKSKWDGLHQLKYNNVTVWDTELIDALLEMTRVATIVAKGAIHYFLHEHDAADAHMFELTMCDYDI